MTDWPQLFGDFHFLRPLWLLALLPLAALWWWLRQARGSDRAWQTVCDPHLLPHLLITRHSGNQPLLLWLLALAWLLTVLALAGPTWSQRPQPVFQSLETRVIVLDLSRSMAAPDLKPSRLARAKFKVADILAQNEDGQVGLVVFAGDAFVVVPITQDTATIRNLLPALDVDLMPVQGSRVDLGLAKALDLFTQSGINQGSVLLICDGANGQAAADAAQQLATEGFSVSVLGVGTAQGAPIPSTEGELLKDANGTIVIPRLNDQELRALARVGEGRYTRIRADGADLDQLLAVNGINLLSDHVQRTDQRSESWQEQGPWLVLLLLPFAALAFRRGWMLALLLCLFAPPPASFAQATSNPWSELWTGLWQRRDQQAQTALANDNPQRAVELATDPWQLGTAAYRAGDYGQAAESFAQLDNPSGHYNLGNSLAKLGQYAPAIAAYDKALAEQPDMEDARINRDIVKKLLEQQQQQQQQQQSGDQQQQADQDGQQSEQQNSQQSEQQEPQNSAQQDSQGTPEDNPEAQRQEQQGEQGQEHPQADQQDSEDSDEQQQADPQPDDQDAEHEEQQQVLEQWLRRIPDDPGGLLRRKFLYQYQRRASQAQPEQAW